MTYLSMSTTTLLDINTKMMKNCRVEKLQAAGNFYVLLSLYSRSLFEAISRSELVVSWFRLSCDCRKNFVIKCMLHLCKREKLSAFFRGKIHWLAGSSAKMNSNHPFQYFLVFSVMVWHKFSVAMVIWYFSRITSHSDFILMIISMGWHEI